MDEITGTDLTESTYLIQVEMVDGSSQLAQITKEQALSLGIEFPEANTVVPAEAIKDSEHLKRKITTQNIDLFNPNKKVKIRYNYKVINPQDLNLTQSPRGRPKKGSKEEVKIIKKPLNTSNMKTHRTRCGRVTRPPEHMQKVFENVVIEGKSYDDVLTTEFKPLTTTNATTKEFMKKPVLVTLSDIERKKKRVIPSQYRCSTCKKAYLGRSKMSQHLRKHPDHGIVSQVNMVDGETWCCLIETALKTREGHKGIKFCQELLSLVKNARTLVKYFFKPSKQPGSDPTGTEYYVDTLLSNVLNIKEGYYRFKENELCKDISIFSFLEIFDESFCSHVINLEELDNKTNFDHNLVTSSPIKSYEHNILSLGDELDCNKKLSTNQSNEFVHKNDSNSNKGDVNLHFGSDIMDVFKSTENTKNIDPKVYFGKNIDNVKINVFSNIIDSFDGHNIDIINVLNCNKESNEKLNAANGEENSKTNINNTSNKNTNKIENENINVNNIHNIQSHSYSHSNNRFIDNLDKGKKPHFENDKHGKEIDIFRPTINNILNIGASDEHMIQLLEPHIDSNKVNSIKPILSNGINNTHSSDNLINVPNDIMINQNMHNIKQLDTTKHIFDDHLVGKQSDDYDTNLKNNYKKSVDFVLNKLHNDLLTADELILPDTGQVTSILDTSTSSDDIMNVDQFVNERFKKLTEVDMELQSGGLNLDLPIDCFNFHTS